MGPNIFRYFYLIFNCLLGLIVASTTPEQEVLGAIPGSDKVILGFSLLEFLSGSHGVWISARLMAIDSTLKKYQSLTNHLCLTPTGFTDVMLCLFFNESYEHIRGSYKVDRMSDIIT